MAKHIRKQATKTKRRGRNDVLKPLPSQTRYTSGKSRIETTSQRKETLSQALRDIAPIPLNKINWKRRNACEKDLGLFGATYFAPVFSQKWGTYHRVLIDSLERVITTGGMQSMAVPRGGGKTALCRAAIIWATVYAYRQFGFFVGSRQESAQQTLEFIRVQWVRNPLLAQDFPEIAYAVAKCEGRNNSTAGQLHRGERTFLNWSAGEVRYPSLIFNETDIQAFPRKSVIRIPQFDNSYRESDGYTYGIEGKAYTTKNAGAIIRCEGIDGSLRGNADVHPLFLTQPRPDLILLDDIQKDQGADSPTTCDKLELLIDGAIEGLAGPGESISAIMPCTVIRQDDVSDRYLSLDRKPDWQGKRFGMVERWPDGITDDELTDETETSRAWLEYARLRTQSIRELGSIRLATEYYRQNRELMDNGFVCSWDSRYRSKDKDGDNQELSAQQHAMNLRLKSPQSFAAEYQNKPKSRTQGGTAITTVSALMERYTSIERNVIPAYCNWLTAFVDIQDEYLPWLVLAGGPDFSGIITDYGWYPQTNRLHPQNFRDHMLSKLLANKYKELSNSFYQAYPDQKPAKYSRTEPKKAPLEAKIYYGLNQVVSALLARRFVRDDGLEMQINLVGVDAQWGLITPTVYKFVRDKADTRILPCHGKFIGAASKGFDEYQPKPGLWIGNHCLLSASTPNQDTPFSIRHLVLDSNYWKSNLHNRLAIALGSPGAIILHSVKSPLEHEMLARHIAGSEYPEPVKAKGRTVDEWRELPDRFDNEYLDCAYSALCLQSVLGAKAIDEEQTRPVERQVKPSLPREYKQPVTVGRSSMRDVWQQKKGR